MPFDVKMSNYLNSPAPAMLPPPPASPSLAAGLSLLLLNFSSGNSSVNEDIWPHVGCRRAEIENTEVKWGCFSWLGHERTVAGYKGKEMCCRLSLGTKHYQYFHSFEREVNIFSWVGSLILQCLVYKFATSKVPEPIQIRMLLVGRYRVY